MVFSRQLYSCVTRSCLLCRDIEDSSQQDDETVEDFDELIRDTPDEVTSPAKKAKKQKISGSSAGSVSTSSTLPEQVDPSAGKPAKGRRNTKAKAKAKTERKRKVVKFADQGDDKKSSDSEKSEDEIDTEDDQVSATAEAMLARGEYTSFLLCLLERSLILFICLVRENDQDDPG